ncbi:MAG: hypothetical protein AABY07_00695 [Nanoarchaeota archaeon]
MYTIPSEDVKTVLSNVGCLMRGIREGYFDRLASRRLPSRRVLDYLKEEIKTDRSSLGELSLNEWKSHLARSYELLENMVSELSLVESGDIATVLVEGQVEIDPTKNEIDIMRQLLGLQIQDDNNPLIALSKNASNLIVHYASFCNSNVTGSRIDSGALRPYVSTVISSLDDYEIVSISQGDSMAHLIKGVERLVELSKPENAFFHWKK